MVDLAALLYLNPQLVADYGLTSIQAAQAALPSLNLSQLSVQLPSVPPGFDSRVFVAAQPDVSSMNDTIRRAMKAMGLSDLAMEKRGAFVATIMEDVILSTILPVVGQGQGQATATLSLLPNSKFALTPNVVRQGDTVRMIRKSIGDELIGQVKSVAADGRSLVAELSGPKRAIVSGPGYTLVGIRIHDCERQAAVSYARMLRSITTALPVEDIGPSADFSLGTYHAVYPETRPLGLQDSYLDYRARWKRDNEYRVIRGRDIFNLAAPYTSNLLPGVPGEAGSDFQVLGKITAGTASLGSDFMMVGPSNATFGSNTGTVAAFEGGCNVSVRLVGSNVVVGPQYVSALASNLVISSGSLSAVSGSLVVAGSSTKVGNGALDISYSNVPMVGMCGGAIVASGSGGSNWRLDVGNNALTASEGSNGWSLGMGAQSSVLSASASTASTGGRVSICADTVIVERSSVSVAGNFLAVGPSNMSVGPGALDIVRTAQGTHTVGLIGSNLTVTPTSFAAMGNLLTLTQAQGMVLAASSASLCSHALEVDTSGINVCGSTIVATSHDSNSSRVSLCRDAIVVERSNGGSGWTSTNFGNGAMTVVRASSSNEPTTTIRGAVSATDRVGIGMQCWGTESAACDSTGTAATTRLAVDGDVYLTGCVVSLSDERAKTAVRPLDHALDRVSMMSGYTFEKAGDGQRRRHTGLLAQEVKMALPEAVYDVPGSSGMSSVAYGNVVGLLVQAVNELRAEVRDLRRGC